MKKITLLVFLSLITVLLSGCSLWVKPLLQDDGQVPAVNWFDYSRENVKADEVLVRSESITTLTEQLTLEGSTVVKRWPTIGWALVTVPTGKDAVEFAKMLRTREEVLLATPNIRYNLNTVPTVPQYANQWGFTNIRAEAAWSKTQGNSKVIVAVIDSGVDVQHTEFAGKTFIAPYDATTGGSTMMDLNGHGTHVAGIAADDGRTGLIAGVAWNSPIMPIRVQDDWGGVYTSYIVDALYYLGTYMRDHQNYRAVANLSFGVRSYDFAVKDAIDYVMEQGVVVVAAAGNTGDRIANYPAAFNGVISVAASTPYDQRAIFSTKGFWNSVAAPGEQILSTYPNGQYAWMDGTSMSAPYVTGAAALLLSLYPDLTPVEVKNQLEATARGTVFSEELGYGVIDMTAMLGTIKPLNYGGLNVQTNILPPTGGGAFHPGVVSIYDTNQRLISFGTTGEYGNYIFHALRPGSYTVQLSSYDPILDQYITRTTQAMVVVDTMLTVEMIIPGLM